MPGFPGEYSQRFLQSVSHMEAQTTQPITALEAQITELAGHLNAGNHRFLVLIAEFDRRNGWSDSATQSCAHWLNWKCGIDMGTAREKVRVSRALETLPRVSAAMARGELSYSKVRAITRVGTPETEELLLSIALHGTANHIERTVRCFRRAQQAEELSREARQQAARNVSYIHDADGSLIVKASLPAELGALFIKALNAAVDAVDARERAAKKRDAGEHGNPGEQSRQQQRDADTGDYEGGHVSAETSSAANRSPTAEDPTPGERPSWGARRADALARIAESFLAHGAEALLSGDRYQAIVHIDAETLHEGGAGRCEHEDGPALPIETARRLSCDASRVCIVEDENGEPLNVGRKTRTIAPAIRRALRSRDRGCRFPGCPNKHYVDGHHIKHWANGGETRLSNLALLCRFHHREVHEGGVAMEALRDGTLRFTMKNGRSFDSLVPARPGHEQGLHAEDVLQGDWTSLLAHDADGIVITKDTATTRWRGERMDYSIAIDALLYQSSRHAADVSAETSRGSLGKKGHSLAR
jgi:hypothetical protein